jgi:hypothetical protein
MLAFTPIVVNGKSLVDSPSSKRVPCSLPAIRFSSPGNGIVPDPKWVKPPGYLDGPERYGKPATSGLTVEVVADPQTKDFDLDFK